MVFKSTCLRCKKYQISMTYQLRENEKEEIESNFINSLSTCNKIFDLNDKFLN